MKSTEVDLKSWSVELEVRLPAGPARPPEAKEDDLADRLSALHDAIPWGVGATLIYDPENDLLGLIQLEINAFSRWAALDAAVLLLSEECQALGFEPLVAGVRVAHSRATLDVVGAEFAVARLR